MKPFVLLWLPACADVLALPDDPVLAPLSSSSGASMCADAPANPTRDVALVRVHACDFSRSCTAPVTGLSGVLCAKLDPQCVTPVVAGIYDINGDMAFEVPTGGAQGKGFDGFLHLKMPVASCTDEAAFGIGAGRVCSLSPGCDPMHLDDKCLVPTYPDAFLYFNPAITNDVAAPISVPLVPTTALAGLQMASGVRMPDLSTGIVFINVLDCNGEPAAGATVDYLERTTSAATNAAIYLSQGALTPIGPTDTTGVGGLIAVPSGYKRVVARRETADGSETGSAYVNVAPFAFTYVSVVLTPSN